MNFLPTTLGEGEVDVRGAKLPVPRGLGASGANVIAGFRPESLIPAGPGEGLAVTVNMVEELGSDAYVYGALGNGDDSEVRAHNDIIARTDPRQPPAIGSTVRYHVRPGELHLFDADTGLRLT